MSNYRPIIFLCLWMAILLGGCVAPAGDVPAAGAEAAAPATSAERGTLRITNPMIWSGKESLDPSSATNFAHATVLLYDRLTRTDADGVPQPELATAWQANADATEWTFTLRTGVTFHDGKPFTSADVAYTFARILDPEQQSPMAATLALLTETATPDEQTIIFKLNQGHADFPLLVSHRLAGIIPAESGATIATSGIGTGPFTVETFVADGTTVVRANDDYWKGKPGLAGIELIAMADAEARTLAMQAGQLDLLVDVTATQAELFAGAADATVLKFPSGRFVTLVMRTNTPPFDDLRVRQALRLVADRQVMTALVLNGEGTVACDTPVMPADAYRWNGECPQDIEGAKALLAEAGYPDGLDVTLYASEVAPELVPLAEVYQQQAAAAGINVSLEIAPADSFWSEVWMVQPFFTSFWQERPADQILNEAWRATAKWNESAFQNPAFDQLLDQARTELDFDARRERYQAAQQLIADEGGNLIPFHVNQFYVVSSKVTGVPARNWQQMEWHTISKSE